MSDKLNPVSMHYCFALNKELTVMFLRRLLLDEIVNLPRIAFDSLNESDYAEANIAVGFVSKISAFGKTKRLLTKRAIE